MIKKLIFFISIASERHLVWYLLFVWSDLFFFSVLGNFKDFCLGNEFTIFSLSD